MMVCFRILLSIGTFHLVLRYLPAGGIISFVLLQRPKDALQRPKDALQCTLDALQRS
jgi:hypothetical protein